MVGTELALQSGDRIKIAGMQEAAEIASRIDELPAGGVPVR